jgi:hypothetical protein
MQFELAEEVLQERFKSTKLAYPNVYVGTSFSIRLDSIQGQNMLKIAMDAVQPKVLILDPLYKIMDGDENEGVDMKVIVNFLDEKVIEAYDCSVLLIHHAGKDMTKRGRGSTVLEGWVDSLIEMKRKSGDHTKLTATLTPKMLRHSELPPEPITVELTNGEFKLSVNPEDTVYDLVYKYLKRNKNGDHTPENIMEEIPRGSGTAVHEALNQLVEEGYLEKVRKGHYKWKATED